LRLRYGVFADIITVCKSTFWKKQQNLHFSWCRIMIFFATKIEIIFAVFQKWCFFFLYGVKCIWFFWGILQQKSVVSNLFSEFYIFFAL